MVKVNLRALAFMMACFCTAILNVVHRNLVYHLGLGHVPSLQNDRRSDLPHTVNTHPDEQDDHDGRVNHENQETITSKRIPRGDH